MVESKSVIEFKDSVIRNLKPPPGKDRGEWRFRGKNGLGIRVYAPTPRYPEGRKVFNGVYRFGSRQERVRLLPDYPMLGVTGAGKQWEEILAKSVLGTNTAELRRERRRPDKPKVQPKTVVAVIAEYTRDRLDHLSDNHRTNTTHFFDTYVKPRWGKFLLADITRDHARDLIQGIIDAGKPITANRVQSALVALFNWVVEEAQYLSASPMKGLKRRVIETPRDRTLTDVELTVILGGARRLPYPYGSFVLALAGLGQRRTEVAKMRSGDISGGVWVIPGTDSKNRKSHRLVLPPFVLEVLDNARSGVEENIRRHCEETGRPAPEVAPGFDYLFGGRYKGSFTAFSLCKRKLEATVAAFCAETRLPAPAEWTFHDLRRTCGSVLARLGVPSKTIGRLMNHTEAGVTAKVYITHSYEREVGDALRLWSDYLTRLERRERVVPSGA